MQDRYTGDIGDYGKLGMLRHLAAAGLRVGVNWYRTPNEDHNEDGRFTQYAHDNTYRDCDPHLWASLAQILDTKQRRVESLETPDILDAVFYSELLDFRKVSFWEREEKRADWHRQALSALNGCELVFVDPDNGLMVPSARRSKKANKYVLPEELFDYYQQGASVIYYQHKARRQDSFYTGQHNKLLRNERVQGAEGLGLKFARTSLRYYCFLLRPEHAETVRQSVASLLASPWGGCFKLR